MHGALDTPLAPRRHWPALPLGLRLALRGLRGGLKGFATFIACIALGVAAIAGVASVARSLTEGLAREGRTILGGDIAFALIHREATPSERAFLAAEGAVSSIATLRAMANAGDKGTALVELKAVDAAYPTVGALITEPDRPAAALLAAQDDVFGAVADPVLMARLGLAVGARIAVGGAALELRANLVSEPDKIAGGIGFGPRLIVSQEALRASGLLQPGSLVRWIYRINLPGAAASAAAIDAVVAEANRRFPQAGWDIRSRLNAEPRFAKNIERFTQFLTLVGLTALLVGGVGVANAVRGFVDRKRADIAVLKGLGAPGGRVVGLLLVEVMLIASLGIAVGLVIGAAMPFAVAAVFGPILPVPLAPTLSPAELALALAYGALAAFVFAIGPLGRAHDVPVSGLFRDAVEPDRRWPRRRYRVWLILAAAALIGLAVAAAYDRRVAVIFVVAALGAFALLRGVAALIMTLARGLPRPRRPAPRLALANLYRPGALTASLVLSLGLGITLLVALAVIDANLTRQLTRTLPGTAPSFFFLDIPNAETERFDAFLAGHAPSGRIERVPMMRGRLVALKGVPVARIRTEEQYAWVLEGDRGITYTATVPDGSEVVAGAWWPPDYRGRPLVSVERDIAAALGLEVGDEIVVNVLGRNLSATIANLRKVEWRTLGINFVFVFSPNTFAGAPHTHLATVTFPGGADPGRDAGLLRAMAQAFPMVTSLRVKDALDAVNAVVEQLVAAIRGASAVALAASLLVLAGALAASHRARLYDAVVLKTLGATRATLLLTYALEYGVLGAATAVFGLLAGTAAAYLIVTRVMNLGFALELSGAVASAALAVCVAVGLGLVGTWRILSQRPAPYLRNL